MSLMPTAEFEEACDHVQHMLLREATGPRIDPRNSKYQSHRRIIVDWMQDVAGQFNLSRLTLHAAVHYLDHILCRLSVHTKRFQLVAIATLLIAAKFEEADGKAPLPVELNRCAANIYTLEEITKMEGLVLKSLEWRVCCLTPAHFVSVFSPFILRNGCEDFVQGQPMTADQKKQVTTKLSVLATAILNDLTFVVRHSASKIAAACLYHARERTGLKLWTARLQQLTTYAPEDLHDCLEDLRELYAKLYVSDANKENRSPDSVVHL
jgi:cyclin A